MSKGENKNPVQAALNRIYNDSALRVACIIIVGHDQFVSKAKLLDLAGATEFEAAEPSLSRSILDQIAKVETHRGKSDGAARLLGLVHCGVVTADDGIRLLNVARLVSSERELEIDALYEVGRRIVVMHLESEAWR